MVVVVGLRPLVEVVAFRMVDEREVVIAVGVHVLKPCGEFHAVDAQIDADAAQLAAQLLTKLGTVDTRRVGERQLERVTGGIPRLLHEALGFGGIVRIQAGQVLVAGVNGRDWPTERRIHSPARGDDLLVVNRIADCLPYAFVGGFRTRAVEREHEFVAAVVRLDGVFPTAFELAGHIRVDRGQHLHVPAGQRVERRVVVRQEAHGDCVRAGLVRAAPIFRVRLQDELTAGIE